MLSYMQRRYVRFLLYAIVILFVVMAIVSQVNNWWLVFPFFILAGATLVVLIIAEFKLNKQIQQTTNMLASRVQKAEQRAVSEMPLGLLIYNEESQVEWMNAYMRKYFDYEEVIGLTLNNEESDLWRIIQNATTDNTQTIQWNNQYFEVTVNKNERFLYLQDANELEGLVQENEENQIVIGVIFLDNYDEWTQGMDDRRRGALNNIVTSTLGQWARTHAIFLKRMSSERYTVVMRYSTLVELEQNKFGILDVIREKTSKKNIPLTLSIGLAYNDPDLTLLAELSQSSLDLALGRGGDQVVIKQPEAKVRFYGGKTNPMEKRTRVRARVISQALQELISQSDNVVVVGHRFPDMDVIGSCLGIRKIAEMNGKDAYVVVDTEMLNDDVQRLMSEIDKNTDVTRNIISPQKVKNHITKKTLLVVVDTHNPAMVEANELLDMIDQCVIIDHHRRSEHFIEHPNPVLVYIEPYASSTAELITELFEYQPTGTSISAIEATAMLAGIVVDTKNFTLRTGSRTFDAASYLRSLGADTVLVQQFLKENLDTFVKRNRLVETMSFYHDGMAITMGPDDVPYNNVLAAQAADRMLGMEGVEASFVLFRREDDRVGISARSLGEINVQIIMEMLDGGGHLSNAATQIADVSCEEAEVRLKEAIDAYWKGEE